MALIAWDPESVSIHSPSLIMWSPVVKFHVESWASDV